MAPATDAIVYSNTDTIDSVLPKKICFLHPLQSFETWNGTCLNYNISDIKGYRSGCVKK